MTQTYIIDCNLDELISDFNNFWHEYFWYNWPSNDCSRYHLAQHLFLHYLGEAERANYYVFNLGSAII